MDILGRDAYRYCIDDIITTEKTYEFMKKNTRKPLLFYDDIKKVIYNFPATIVIWEDGTKTVVKCHNDEVFDPEKGLAMAICKKAFGNEYDFHQVFKKWKLKPVVKVDKESKNQFQFTTEQFIKSIKRFNKAVKKFYGD